MDSFNHKFKELSNGNTDRFRSIAASTFVNVKTDSQAGVFGTMAGITPPTTFTADDQKRWTNYTLAQKEQSKLLERQFRDGIDRIGVLEDGLQEIEDQMGQISTYSEAQLHGLLNMIKDWAGEFEQIMDGFR